MTERDGPGDGGERRTGDVGDDHGPDGGDGPTGDGVEEAGADGGSEPTGDGEDIPLSSLREDVEGRRDAGPAEDAFLREEVGGVESAAVWADLLMGEGDTTGLVPPTDLDGEFQIVTTTLCHRCQYFGDPPALHCTHDGTTIHETADMDHYRVSGCPMVAQDRD